MLLPTQSTHSCWWYFHTKCPVSCSLPYFYSTVIQKLLNLDIGILKSTRCFGTKCPPPYRFLPFMPWAVYLWHNRLATRARNVGRISISRLKKFRFNDGKWHHSTAHYSTVQYSTVQYCTVPHITVQYRTAELTGPMWQETLWWEELLDSQSLCPSY